MSALTAGKADSRTAAALSRISGKSGTGVKDNESQQVASIRSRPIETIPEEQKKKRGRT